MAKLNGIKAVFGANFVEKRMKEFIKSVDDKMLKTLQYKGEEFVNKARVNGNYLDQTGNLRSSIGYIILNNGKIIYMSFKGVNGVEDGETGKLQGMEVAGEIALNYPNGWVLIGVAGMNYAAAVEHMGYDVITGSAPRDEELKSILSEIKF